MLLGSFLTLFKIKADVEGEKSNQNSTKKNNKKQKNKNYPDKSMCDKFNITKKVKKLNLPGVLSISSKEKN